MSGNWKRLLAAALAASMILGDSSFAYAAESQPIENASIDEQTEQSESSDPDEDVVDDSQQGESVEQETAEEDGDDGTETPNTEIPESADETEEILTRDEASAVDDDTNNNEGGEEPDSLQKLDRFDGCLTISAGETVQVNYEGKRLGDYFIEQNENVSFTSGSVGEGLEQPVTYQLLREQNGAEAGAYYVYAATEKYTSNTTDKFSFQLKNESETAQDITIINSCCFSGYMPGEETFITNAKGEPVGYYSVEAIDSAYLLSDFDWVMLEGKPSLEGEAPNVRLTNHELRDQRVFCASTGDSDSCDNYYGKITSPKADFTEQIEHFSKEYNNGVKIRFSEDGSDEAVNWFYPSESGEYFSKQGQVEVFHKEKDYWEILSPTEKGSYNLIEDAAYIVVFYGEDIFGLNQKDITVLDYDYYQAFTASGGTVTIDGSEVTITPNKNAASFLKNFASKLLTMFGISNNEEDAKYEECTRKDFEDANLYWKCKQGSFVAREFYKIETADDGTQTLVDCAEDMIQEGDVVVVKYEPSIVWVESMTLSADQTQIGVGDTTQIHVDAKAATEKYPLRNPIYTYISSDESVLTVDRDGLVTAHKAGTAKVTVLADVALREWQKQTAQIKKIKKEITINVGVVYDITYENVEGYGQLAEDTPESYHKLAATTLVDPIANEGYEFAGWYSDAKLTKKIISIAKNSTGDKTVYAKWSLHNYDINYNLGGGQFPDDYPTTFTIEGGTALETPTWYGHQFVGWSCEETELPTDEETGKYYIPANIKQDLTLTAEWELNATYQLKVNFDGDALTHPYNIVTGQWEASDLNYTVETNPSGMEVYFWNVTARLYKKGVEEAVWKTGYSMLPTIPAEKIKEPGTYRLEAEMFGISLEPVEFEVKLAKREYPANKEFEWNAISNFSKDVLFEDLVNDMICAMQPEENAFYGGIGEQKVANENITIKSIKNAKNKVVKMDSKIASGTYTVTYDIGENERFHSEVTAKLKISYGALAAAGVVYETTDADRAAGSTIAFGVGEEKSNKTFYPSDVTVIPQIKTPWGTVVSAEKLADELEAQGYEGYTVQVAVKEANAKTPLLNIEDQQGTKAVITAAGTTAGKRNLTVTTTISANDSNASVVLTTTVKNFTVVSGDTEAVKTIDLALTGVDEYQPSEDAGSVKSYLLEKSAEKRVYQLSCVTKNYNEEETTAKLTWKSSNAKIASVQAVKNADDATITIPKNAAGVAEITVTANDAGKKSQSIKLMIVDTSMRMDTTSVTLNSLDESNTATVRLYPNVLAEELNGEEDVLASIQEKFAEGKVNLYKKVKNAETKKYEYQLYEDVFDCGYNVGEGELYIHFKETGEKAQTYTVYVGILHDGDVTQPSEVYPLKVKDTCKMPKAPSLKVSKAYETAYQGENYAEVILTLQAFAAYDAEGHPSIQTSDDQKFEVIDWEFLRYVEDGEIWKLKVAAKEQYQDSVFPSGKQTSKTTKGVKFVIGYEEYRKEQIVSANITVTKNLPKLSAYGNLRSTPVYYTDADFREVGVIVPITEQMAADIDKTQGSNDWAEMTVSADGTAAYLGSENKQQLSVSVVDQTKFEIIRAGYVEELGWVNNTDVTGKDAILLKVRVKDGQKKNVSLQLQVGSSRLGDDVKITTGKLTIKAAKVASEAIQLYPDNGEQAVKRLTFNSVYKGKESVSLYVSNRNLEAMAYESVQVLLEGADAKSRAMLKKDALMISIYDDTKRITLSTTENTFDYSGCKLKVTLQVTDEAGKTCNTKSTILSVDFKKSLQTKITVPNVKLTRGMDYHYTGISFGKKEYSGGWTFAKLKITNAPAGAYLTNIRFADPADALKYSVGGSSEELWITQCPKAELSLGKDTVELICDFSMENDGIISVPTTMTVTVVDNASLKTTVKSMNLYNSAVGYGQEVEIYDSRDRAVQITEVINEEELKKAGINYEVVEDGRMRFYVDGNLKRGIEKTYTVKVKAGLVNSVENNGTQNPKITSVAAEKTLTFKIVLKK